IMVSIGEIALIIIVLIILGILLSGIHILKEWQRAPVLTLGRYTGLKGPGLIYVTPIISKITVVVSTRIQAVAFKTESTYTQDNVPVNVDAVMYFQVIDADKAVLNVENYATATQLAAQTTLREVLGKSSFDEILSEREKVGEAARQIIDEKTEHWGVKVSSVEIRDVLVPQALQDAMSRQAAAERERRSRVTLALAEVEAAGKMVDAAKQYENNPTAFQLRWMDIVYQIGLEGKGSLIMIPQNVPTAGDTSQFFTATALESILSKNTGNTTNSGNKPQ
ncbi:peptidase, partial [Acidiplasma aeolicum]